MSSRDLFAAVAACITIASPAVARGEGEGGIRLPIPYAQRPMTLPAATLVPTLGLGIARSDLVRSLFQSSSPNSVYLSMDVTFGILDDLQVSANLVPVRLSPNTHYGSPSLGLLYRFFKGKVELGGSLYGSVFTEGISGGALYPGLPLRARLGGSARLDTGLYASLAIYGEPIVLGIDKGNAVTGTVLPGVSVPLGITGDVAEVVHLFARSGLRIDNLRDPGRTIAVPLRLGAGITLSGAKGPSLDIDAWLDWSYLITPGASPVSVLVNGQAIPLFPAFSGDKTHPGTFTFWFQLQPYFFL